MNDIISIKGIEGYEKDGTVYLKLGYVTAPSLARYMSKEG